MPFFGADKKDFKGYLTEEEYEKLKREMHEKIDREINLKQNENYIPKQRTSKGTI